MFRFASNDRLLVDCMHRYRLIFDETQLNLRRIFLHEDRVFSSILIRQFIQLANENEVYFVCFVLNILFQSSIDEEEKKNCEMSSCYCPQRLNLVLDAAFVGSIYKYDREVMTKLFTFTLNGKCIF